MLAEVGAVDLTLLLNQIIVFVLAMFVGFELISKVPATLHTPLMSGSNAIDGIKIVGALLIAGSATGPLSSVIGFIAVAAASINVVGGFLVTDRMLSMFKARPGGTR
jgi:NAD(P) transhydrogenase subunit alpha